MIRFIYLFQRQNYRERGKDRERQRSTFCYFIPQVATVAGTGPGGSQELRTLYGSLLWMAGAQIIGLSSSVLLCLPLSSQGISKEKDWKWNSQDWNLHSDL